MRSGSATVAAMLCAYAQNYAHMRNNRRMNLSQPLADLLGANTAKVLQHLAVVPSELSGRRIAQLAGVPPRSADAVLRDLVEIGLVRVREVAPSRQYRLNRNHLLWYPIRTMLEIPATVIERLTELPIEHLRADDTLVLFGSVARREAGRTSDVDLLLVWATDEHDPDLRARTVDDLAFAVEQLTGNRADITDLGREQLDHLARAEDPFIAAVLRESITLHGPALRTLLDGAMA